MKHTTVPFVRFILTVASPITPPLLCNAVAVLALKLIPCTLCKHALNTHPTNYYRHSELRLHSCQLLLSNTSQQVRGKPYIGFLSQLNLQRSPNQDIFKLYYWYVDTVHTLSKFFIVLDLLLSWIGHCNKYDYPSPSHYATWNNKCFPFLKEQMILVFTLIYKMYH